MTTRPSPPATAPSRLSAIALGCAATLAIALLYAPWIAEPHIRYDDFNFLTSSRTWAETLGNLWQPMNEHMMPLARMGAGALMLVAQPQSAIPRAAQIHGVVAVVVGMWLLYEFIRRELGHPFYGVIAMTLWGVTSTFYECVTWYSASFFTLALDLTLAGLLAAQAYQRGRGAWALAACAICAALAPAVHGTALLAGAWCALYLLVGQGDQRPPGVASLAQRMRVAAVPMLGSVAFIGVGLLASAGQIVNAEHYRGKTIFAAFNPAEGLKNTLRTLADNQIPGAFGIWDRHSTFAWPTVLAIVSVVAVLGILWWRAAPHRRLLALGLAVTIGSDLLVYSARADWSYERSVHNWTRYHLFPHLGLVLFAVGGLPRFEGRWFALARTGHLSARQVTALAGLVIAMFVSHRPRSHGAHFDVPDQLAVLQRIERVDERCRSARIEGETARQALGFLQFPLAFEGDNAWEFLRCSSSPVPTTVDTARELLGPIQ